MKKIWIGILLLLTPLARGAEPVFDMHVHLREGEASASKFEAEVREAGLDLVGYAAMWFGGPHQAPAGNPADIRKRNDEIIALGAKHPKAIPVATVHPYDGKAALDELTRVAGRGIKVLKLHPHTQQFDASDPRVLALARRAGELGVAVLMDNASIVPDDCQKLFNLAAQAQNTRFIFAHIGALEFRFWNILALARTADGFALNNVYFDISGMAVLAADAPIEAEFVWTLRNVGIDHVLLASDYPQMSLKQHADGLEKLDLTSEEKARIRIGNARKLFGLAQ